MVRTILAILAGLVAALATMLGLEYVGMSMFPLPPGIDLDNEADLARLVASATLGKKLWVLLAWSMAALVGGWLAARLARAYRAPAALVVGGLIVVGVAVNAALLPHPAWMTVAGVLLPMPLAWLAGRLAAPRARADAP